MSPSKFFYWATRYVLIIVSSLLAGAFLRQVYDHGFDREAIALACIVLLPVVLWAWLEASFQNYGPYDL